MGGDADGEAAGFGVDVAGLGLFADPVLVQGCAVNGCWSPDGAVAIVPGVGDWGGGDGDVLAEHGEVKGLYGGCGPDVGFFAAEGVRSWLAAEFGRYYWGALELVGYLPGDLSEEVPGLLVMDAGRAGVEGPRLWISAF